MRVSGNHLKKRHLHQLGAICLHAIIDHPMISWQYSASASEAMTHMVQKLMAAYAMAAHSSSFRPAL